MNKFIEIKYFLSEQGRKKSLLNGGDGKQEQVIEAEITPELIEKAKVDNKGNAVIIIDKKELMPKLMFSGITESFKGYRWDVDDSFYEKHKPEIEVIKQFEKVYFDEPQTLGDLLLFLSDLKVKEKAIKEETEKQVRKLEEQLPIMIAKWEKAVQAHKEEKLQLEKINMEREKRKKDRENKKTDWINQYGSDYLKRATKLGYDCQRQYVIESAIKEFPDYEVDFDDELNWKERVCPSLNALDEVEDLINKGYEAKVVWLTNWVGLEEETEAIVIRNYLDQYDLVKKV